MNTPSPAGGFHSHVLPALPRYSGDISQVTAGARCGGCDSAVPTVPCPSL